jgi:hypothetical protein
MAVTRDDVQDASGRRTFVPGRGWLRGFTGLTSDYTAGTGVPKNGIGGFAPGCTYQNMIGSAGSTFYINTGTVTSATWLNIDGAVGTGKAAANSAVTATSGTTLTAAQIVGKLITRSGPTGAFSDTTDTAAAIITALAGDAVGTAFFLDIINTTAFAETILNGVGVTLSGNVVIPPLSVGRFLVTYATATTVTMYGVETIAMTSMPLPVITALSTVGAGTITAAGIVGGVTVRTGSTAAFTDTTDTVADLIAAYPNTQVGQSWYWTYQNGTNSTATIQGASNVTVSGITNVPPATWVTFLVTYATATTFTMQAVAFGELTPVPPLQWSTGTTTTTFTAGELTGAKFTVYNNTQGTPGTITTRTAGQMFGDIPNCVIGFSYILRIINGQGTGTLTVAVGSGVTNPNTSTLTIATNTWRDFMVTFTSATAATITELGTGTNS